jgi:hypothetical protein
MGMRQFNLVFGAILWCVHFDEISSTLNQEASFKIVTGGTRVVTGGTCRKKFYQIKQIMDGSHKTCKFFVKAAMFFIH